jgi:hypothetical protein
MAGTPRIVRIDHAARKRQTQAKGEQHAQNAFHRSVPMSSAKANARMVSTLLPESMVQATRGPEGPLAISICRQTYWPGHTCVSRFAKLNWLFTDVFLEAPKYGM